MSVNNSLVCGPLLRYGSEAQIKRYLPLLPAESGPAVTH